MTVQNYTDSTIPGLECVAKPDDKWVSFGANLANDSGSVSKPDVVRPVPRIRAPDADPPCRVFAGRDGRQDAVGGCLEGTSKDSPGPILDGRPPRGGGRGGRLAHRSLGAHPAPCGEFWHGESPLVVIFWHGARISCIDLHLYSAPLDVVLCPLPVTPGYRAFGNTAGPVHARS